jgi:DNA gyrase subunit A
MLRPEEKVQAVISLKEFSEDSYLMMGTKKGVIKKTTLSAYSHIRKVGLNAITLREDDELISVRMTNGHDEIMMVSQNGYSIRFKEEDARSLGRTASGVRGMFLREGDNVVSMNVVDEELTVLVVSENGFGKKTAVSEYKTQNRGGMGIITYKATEKTGKVVAAIMVSESDELMLINSNDIAIRINVADISTTGRSAMGVTLMRTYEEVRIQAIAKINSVEDIDSEVAVEEEEITEENITE